MNNDERDNGRVAENHSCGSLARAFPSSQTIPLIFSLFFNDFVPASPRQKNNQSIDRSVNQSFKTMGMRRLKIQGISWLKIPFILLLVYCIFYNSRSSSRSLATWNEWMALESKALEATTNPTVSSTSDRKRRVLADLTPKEYDEGKKKLNFLREQAETHGNAGPFRLSTRKLNIFYNIYFPPFDKEPDGNNNNNQSKSSLSPFDFVDPHALAVIDEQLQDISRTKAVEDRTHNVTVRYNTIGVGVKIEERVTYVVQAICGRYNLQCMHLNHYTQANEEVTLQALYDHCSVSAPSPQEHFHGEDDEWVVYMHSKGSYHDNHNNAIWRRNLLQGAMHPQCFDHPNAKDVVSSDKYRVDPSSSSSSSSSASASCNVCGLQFYPIWGSIFPGNFWSASCRYIEQLLPPKHFNANMTNFFNTSTERESYLTFHGVFQEGTWVLGTERFAYEHWVGSHPYLTPCDVSPWSAVKPWLKIKDATWIYNTSSYPANDDERHIFLSSTPERKKKKNNHNNSSDTDTNNLEKNSTIGLLVPTSRELKRKLQSPREDGAVFDWDMAPRHPLMLCCRHQLHYKVMTQVVMNETARLSEDLFLPGRLLRFWKLYGKLPPDNSWLWKYFPDGPTWKHAVAEVKMRYGNGKDDDDVIIDHDGNFITKVLEYAIGERKSN